MLARFSLALTVLTASLTSLFPASAAAQQAPAGSQCTGVISVIRIVEVKPGHMDEYLVAIAKQQAWYKNAGTPDQIQALSVMERDPATRAFTISPTQVITSHTEPANRTEPPHDAGYDAFVAILNESSTVKNTYVTCVVP